jgi:hypothetical protein
MGTPVGYQIVFGYRPVLWVTFTESHDSSIKLEK